MDDPPPGQPQSCDACHKGSGLHDAARDRRARRPALSHRSHLASKKRSPSAPTAASDPARASSRQVPGPDSCKECHGHVEPAKIEVTGGKSAGQQGGRCAFCHAPDEKQSGDFKFEVVRQSGRLEPGHQWHDRSGGCESCHGLGKLEAVVPKLAALSVKSPHPDPDPPLPSLHNEWFNKRDCGRCHTAGQIERRRRDFGGGR